MSLALALNNALTGLNVNQRALSTLSQNIANANTEGYSRQVVDQSPRYIDGVGVGVKIDDISRKVDLFLQRAIRTQDSKVGSADVVSDYLDRLQVYFGQPGAQNSIDEYVTNFFNQIESLAETPELASFRQSAVNSGITLARELYNLAYATEDLRYQADRDVVDSINQVNEELKHLYTLNVAINRGYALGSPTAGLLDQRDIALRKITSLMDVQLTFQESGEVHLSTGNGISLLDDNLSQISYQPAPSVDTFINDGTLAPVLVQQYDPDGNPIGGPVQIVSSGVEGSITTVLTGGKIKGLLDLRDKHLPGVLAQLDSLAAVVRDTFNAIHNDGSGFPGATELTGTRSLLPTDSSEWSGKVQIGIVDSNGEPVSTFYSDETDTGLRPLTLDLSFLDGGFGAGQPTLQSIVDEINQYFGPPNNKAVVGNINNIELVSVSNLIPTGAPPSFTFDFELDNISRDNANFFVTGVTVTDDTAANITNSSNTLPSIALNPASTFVTTAGSTVVTVNTSVPHGLSNGDLVFMNNPGGPVDGIPAGNFNTYFTVQNVTATSYDIVVATPAVAGATTGVPAQIALPPYDTINAGERTRTRDQGAITVDFSGNPGSTFYDITLNVGIDGGPSGFQTAVVTYRIVNNQINVRNDRYSASNVQGGGTLVLPGSTQTYMHAILVDENGNELPKINGNYADQPGFLKLISGNSDYHISINELDSKELGHPNASPALPGTNRGFSHYFELNNFFHSNQPTSTGDTLSGSAIHFAVEDRFKLNSNLITTGQLALSNQPADPNDRPQYTYERRIGDNSVAQRLAKLGTDIQTFPAAGGLPQISQSFNGYAAQILGFAAANAVTASNTSRDSNILLDGFVERSNAISGVNVDEELGNTIVYQNAYSASARIISVTAELFDVLLSIGQ